MKMTDDHLTNTTDSLLGLTDKTPHYYDINWTLKTKSLHNAVRTSLAWTVAVIPQIRKYPSVTFQWPVNPTAMTTNTSDALRTHRWSMWTLWCRWPFSFCSYNLTHYFNVDYDFLYGKTILTHNKGKTPWYVTSYSGWLNLAIPS